jgi:hypothetical protein
MITQERWFSFDEHFQLLNIMAEFERARTAEAQGFRSHRALALEKALELIDLTIGDPKWQEKLVLLLGLREEVAMQYLGKGTMPIATLSAAL